MALERQLIEKLFAQLNSQPMCQFPQPRKKMEAPSQHGVYIIRKGKKVLHVGRTLRRAEGICRRLKDHLYNASSFTDKYLKGNGDMLRKGHTYQCLVVTDARKRALLESYSIGILCPEHIGLGE